MYYNRIYEFISAKLKIMNGKPKKIQENLGFNNAQRLCFKSEKKLYSH